MNKLIETLTKVQQLESKNVEFTEIFDKVVSIEGDENAIVKLAIAVGNCQIIIAQEEITLIDGRGRAITVGEIIDLEISIRDQTPLLINEELESLN